MSDSNNIDTGQQPEPICPHCGAAACYGPDLLCDQGETSCDHCDKAFGYRVEMIPVYTTWKTAEEA